MNFKNLFSLTIRALDFNLLPQHPELVKQLRKLTLHPYSGLNKELTLLFRLMESRPVQSQILLAYRNQKLVGWALLSKERSYMVFSNTHSHFEPEDGMLFEVFIHPDYRRQGIGSELMKVARRKATPYRLCVAPWDAQSRGFYNNFLNYRNKWL
jgi:GNAT superfamily N-acetyltransferase